ncbi:MAG: hypothetical protein CFH44_00384 [Proteobacteria bacterium]|nr:MAG: hypothetical protein CFH44_00384 [Pseudomonadota bacterium]|tara:strand:+ start:439 stop:696 length:258 start_codon:yes stop_codon:yes gene_type:complete
MYDKIFKGCSYLLLVFILAAGILAYMANYQVSGKPYVSIQLSDYNKYSTYSFYCIWIAFLIVFIGFLALYDMQRIKSVKENNESE